MGGLESQEDTNPSLRLEVVVCFTILCYLSVSGTGNVRYIDFSFFSQIFTWLISQQII